MLLKRSNIKRFSLLLRDLKVVMIHNVYSLGREPELSGSRIAPTDRPQRALFLGIFTQVLCTEMQITAFVNDPCINPMILDRLLIVDPSIYLSFKEDTRI